ncbi:transglutaminase domain-containing protein [Cohnella cellulosilytica]|uniref:Transglutaminase domain-containing protein n=2 Tax=Cohnella cellulosilytica TaxID=986710 RepID=A0ABW2FK31_9BACL
MFLTACFGGNETEVQPSKGPKETIQSPSQAVINTSVGGTVLDLKKKYGSDQDKSLMPMYNVPRDKVFEFKFNSNVWGEEDVITVHTDIKAEERSRILSFVSPKDFQENITILEIKPVGSVLSASEHLNGYEGWGNAPIYYIRINYDMDATTPTKLEKPIIVPFTVKSEVEVPNLKANVSSDGRFKLSWNRIEGATEYKIYRRSKVVLLETTNLPVTGAEEAYIGPGPLLEATVKETEYDDFLHDGKGGLLEVLDDSRISGQNRGVNGEYYVTAVKDGKESIFSHAASTVALSSQLPAGLDGDNNISNASFDRASSLPAKVDVTFIDGSTAPRDVIYDVNVSIEEFGQTEIPYAIKGTAMKGFVYVEKLTEADLKALADARPKDGSTGFIAPDNTTDYIPEPDVPTVIEAPSPGAEQDKSLEEAQKENTEQKVEEGNQLPVPAPEVIEDVKLNAETALEEYLAINMIDVQDRISLKAFPEAQNFETISDVLQEVMYQNPLVLGLRGWRYDYRSLTLELKYEESADVIKQKQKEVLSEANKIVAEIFKPDMSDEQKYKAIYDYLNDNTKYDDAALDNAEANEYQEVDPEFNDSFTTYGIMVKKVGVCASYASVYKMLSDMAGLETIVVTGNMSGVPHAWNKVKLANGWVHVDSTNNATNSGIPYLLFYSNDEIAESLDFALSKEFWKDEELSNFASADGSKDYYVANGLEAKTSSEFGSALSKQVKAGSTQIVIRLAARIEQSDLIEEARKVIGELPEDQQERATMGSLSNYVVVGL